MKELTTSELEALEGMDFYQRFKRLDGLQVTALYVAQHVRDAIEDFHSKHLSDEQMAELNPIIRNAIYTGLVLRKELGDHPMLLFNVPEYWEDPELIDI